MENRPSYKELELKIQGLKEKLTEHNHLKNDSLRFKHAIESASDAIGLATPDGNHFFQNRAFEELFGYNLEEIHYLGIRCAIYKNQKIADTVFHEIMTGHSWTGEVEMTSKKGRTIQIHLRANAIKDDEGSVIGLIGIHRDITENKKYEAAIRASEKRFRDVAYCTGDWVWEIDEKGQYTFCSERIYDVLGYKVEEVLGKTPFFMMPREQATKMQKQFKKISRNRDPIIDLENWNITRNGDRVCFLTNGVPKIDENGKYCGYIGTDKNITKRKLAENELRAREAELEQRTYELEETNTALKILLNQRDKDIKETEEKFISNLKEMVFPFLDTLKAGPLSNKQQICLDIVQSYLDDIAAPFIRNLSSRYSDLTPTEKKIAVFIKDGKSTKEIAEVMGTSANAIKFHRANLRRKFALLNKKSNLQSFLSSFSK